MDVILHLGAHCTDGERLLRSLMRNREHFKDLGVSVPGPAQYRDLLREVMIHLRGSLPSPDIRDVVLQTLLEQDEPERLILSNPSFISMPAASLAGGLIYPKAFKVAWLRNIFPDSPVALFLAVRNPATFVPALYARMQGKPDGFEAFLDPIKPMALRWSRTVANIRAACPDCPLTVWCHEESPLLWGEIMRAIAGVPEAAGMHGGFDMVREIMAPEGVKKLRAYTAAHPPANDAVRRRVMGVFLDKYAIDEAIEDVLDLPGWTPDLITHLTDAYEADLAAIASLPGVRMLRA